MKTFFLKSSLSFLTKQASSGAVDFLAIEISRQKSFRSVRPLMYSFLVQCFNDRFIDKRRLDTDSQIPVLEKLNKIECRDGEECQICNSSTILFTDATLMP
ncbi:hypothetical protein T07_11499 [Trichinella nelsoni]|uniref:Uncharacterized protein n=1 Tax=Trichinella nelsoni TaxID=6336 RepID=A0A0V0RL97_9BILA|nr:hypothetical protein T07_11499 [Trichinella nelsoni]